MAHFDSPCSIFGRFVPLLYSLLQSEEECLQAGALEVLTEIASKRMDAEAKLRLLQQLGIVATAASWHRGLPGDPLGEVPLKAARLLSALCSGESQFNPRFVLIASVSRINSSAPSPGVRAFWEAFGVRWRGGG